MSYDCLEVIRIAKAEEGYLEKLSLKNLDSKTANAGAGNYTKYWRDLNPNMQGQPYCDGFVDWCFIKAYGEKMADKLLCGGSRSYYTPTSAGFFKKAGRWHDKNPKQGDVIYFKNATRICHTGIVTDVDARYVYTCEGNTSGANALIPNGGGVCCKKYPLTYASIAGYGRPDYGVASVQEYPKWVKSEGAWYYRVSEGKNAHGWMDIKEGASEYKHRYYFDGKGKMVTGWRAVDGKMYYFQPDGSNIGQLYRSDERGAQSIWFFT